MKQFKIILKKIFFLPPLITIFISLPSFVFVFLILSMGIDGGVAYISYGLSAYALIITITGFTRIIQMIHKGIYDNPLTKKVLEHPFGEQYVTDKVFRAKISLYPSFMINMLYAIVKMISGILYSSTWFITLSVYYILLATMRFLLLTSVRKQDVKFDIALEFKQYRICGVLLALMTLALSGMLLFIIQQDGRYDYPGVLIYVMAVYAFYTVIMAVINIIKFRKHGSPILSAAKAINLTAAIVSMLALETAMLHQFGQNEDYLFRQIMTATSGGAACAFIFGMAVYMMVHATKKLKIENK